MKTESKEIKMTEDQVVTILMEHLKKENWKIVYYCLGSKHGNDIVAEKQGKTMIVEAKGAMANSQSKIKKREKFDSGQIKTHFGKALVKILEEKEKFPERLYAIAHPDDADIKRAIGKIVPFLGQIGIKHYWVSLNKSVKEQ
ncbi:MAG TPA: hypothetical protein DEA97_06890 [Bacteroidales bacterium]|nr:MAG: hypothetical protein UR43_C0013G0018 [candidate division TM6 bacterium GW2011_GWF2_33_332]OFY78401.1 MAG: hypothetical protein A2281_11945 [Bacteroidetes bacterium RIFOXYA12_FULL_38_20]HBS86263.1 hypothetical protein [Bacteroidales bacterium]